MSIFNYQFMRQAFIVGILLSMILSSIGCIVVLKRLSMIGDSLAHTSLAGVAIGIVLGFNPIYTSIIACIIATISIEIIRKHFPDYAEISLAIVMALSVGLVGIFASYIKNGNSLSAYLFGSIVTISQDEFILTIALFVVVAITYIRLYYPLFHIILDEHQAKLSGTNVEYVNFIFSLITAITIAISARIIGSLIVSSLLVLPCACGFQYGKSYLQSVLYSIGFSVFFVIVGLFASYYLALKPGGSIVIVGVITLFLTIIFKRKRVIL